MPTPDIYLLIIATVLGFLAAKFCAGKKAGQQGRFKSLIFKIKKYHIHIHHWIFATAILLIFAVADFYHPIPYGFLSGIIIQGFTYSNFYKIVYR